jgi:hypothetical protein
MALYQVAIWPFIATLKKSYNVLFMALGTKKPEKSFTILQKYGICMIGGYIICQNVKIARLASTVPVVVLGELRIKRETFTM